MKTRPFDLHYLWIRFLDETRRLNRFWRVLLLSLVIGVITGLLVSLLESLVYELLFLTLYNTYFKNGITVIFIPMIGVLITRMILIYGKTDGIGGTEEVVKSYHEFRGRLPLSKTAYKIPAYIATLGFGGSAGLEGASTYLGAMVSSLAELIMGKLNIPYEDQRTLLLAGAGAGLSAMFKAPLTGTIFILQVPYKSDLAPNALIPTLVASVSSYIVMITLKGTHPLFNMANKAQFHTKDLVMVIIIGLVCGFLSKYFLRVYRLTKVWFLKGPAKLTLRNVLAALILGITGYIATVHFGEALPLGPGYIFIQYLLSVPDTFLNLLFILFLKVAAVIFTFSAGGMGGSFFPLLCLGASTGAIVANLAHIQPFDFGVVMGMAGFLAAGYKTPLAAVVFIAETTHSTGYLIPGLICTVFSYIASGPSSISTHQREREDIHLARRFHLKVTHAMTHQVVVVPSNITLEKFRQEYLVKYFLRTYPVLDEHKALVGIISIQDIEKTPPEEWPHLTVSEKMVTPVITVTRLDTIQDAIQKMNKYDLDFLPVISEQHETELVGGVTRSALFQGEWPGAS
ncbi:MAG: chloride channel protein [Leptospirales bacterium]